MKKLILFIFVICIMYACNSSNNNTIEKKEPVAEMIKDSIVTPPAKISYAGCYMMVISKDTAFMHLDDSSGYLSGHLSYKKFEKDNNKGVVTLLPAEKNQLHGWYNFSSEGTQSVREIIFKITDSTLSEGYGDVKMKNDSVYFKYPTVLKFEEKHPFKKRDCK